jgi:hypothetical protein
MTQESCHPVETTIDNIQENVIFDCFQAAIASHNKSDQISHNQVFKKGKWRQDDDNARDVDKASEPDSNFSLSQKLNSGKKQKLDNVSANVDRHNVNKDWTKDEVDQIICEASKIKAWEPALLTRLPNWATNLISLPQNDL